MRTGQQQKEKGPQLSFKLLSYSRDYIIGEAMAHGIHSDGQRPFVLSTWLQQDGNWRIWIKFEAEAKKVWDSGRRHYGSRTIGEFIRHETVLSDSSACFKINNNAFPCLARLFLALHPECDGLFELRGKAA